MAAAAWADTAAALARSKPVRAVLSLAIVFHLVCVLLIPNLESRPGRAARELVLGYVNLLELTDTWSFFAPNPGLPAFVDWEWEDERGQSLGKGRWPEVPTPFFWTDRQARRVSAADFMVADEVRVERLMVPYLCGREPRAASVRLWRMVQSLPTPEEVLAGQRKLGDDVRADRRFVSQGFCRRTP